MLQIDERRGVLTPPPSGKGSSGGRGSGGPGSGGRGSGNRKRQSLSAAASMGLPK